MQLKAILNRVEKQRSFVYSHLVMTEQEGRPVIEVTIQPRANGKAICSGCRQQRPGYDRLAVRRFEFVPLWNIAVFFLRAIAP